MSNNLINIYSILRQDILDEKNKLTFIDPLNVPVHSDGRYYTSFNSDLSITSSFNSLIVGECAVISNLNQLVSTHSRYSSTFSNISDCKTIYLNSPQTEDVECISHDKVMKLYLNDDIYEFTNSIFYNCPNLKFINLPYNLTYIKTHSYYYSSEFSPIESEISLFSNIEDLTVVYNIEQQDKIFKLYNSYFTTNYIQFDNQFYKFERKDFLTFNSNYTDLIAFTFNGFDFKISNSSPNLKTLDLSECAMFDEFWNIRSIINSSDVNVLCDKEIDKITSNFSNLELLKMNNLFSGINQKYNLINKYSNVQLQFSYEYDNYINDCLTSSISSTNELARICLFTRCWDTTTYNSNILKSNLQELNMFNWVCVGPDDNHFSIPPKSYFKDLNKGLNRPYGIYICIDHGFYGKITNTVGNSKLYFSETSNMKFHPWYTRRILGSITDNSFNFNNIEYTDLNFIFGNQKSITFETTIEPFTEVKTLVFPRLECITNGEGETKFLTDESSNLTTFINKFPNLKMMYLDTNVYTHISEQLIMDISTVDFIPVDTEITNWNLLTMTLMEPITKPLTLTNDLLRVCDFTRCWNSSTLIETQKSNLTGLDFKYLVGIGPSDTEFSFPSPDYFKDLTKGLNGNINITLNSHLGDFLNGERYYFNDVENVSFNYTRRYTNVITDSIGLDSINNGFELVDFPYVSFLFGTSDESLTDLSNITTLILPNIEKIAADDVYTNITDNTSGFTKLINRFEKLESLYLSNKIIGISNILTDIFTNVDIKFVETNSDNWTV